MLSHRAGTKALYEGRKLAVLPRKLRRSKRRYMKCLLVGVAAHSRTPFSVEIVSHG